MNSLEINEAGFNRRDFLKGGSFATLMALMGGVPLLADPAPAQPGVLPKFVTKVKVGLIGLGPWGREILDQLGRIEQAEIVAICDNYPAMLRRSASKAPKRQKSQTTRPSSTTKMFRRLSWPPAQTSTKRSPSLP